MTMTGMEEHLAEFLHTNTFEELNIPLVITASDINNAIPVHFEHGKLLPCIIASCSIPVVFTPKEIENIDYVDGGVFMNLPVRPIRKRCEKSLPLKSIPSTLRKKSQTCWAWPCVHFIWVLTGTQISTEV